MDQVFSSFYGSNAKCAGYENKEGKNEDPQLAVRSEQMRLIRCVLYGFVNYSGKGTNSFDLLREPEVCTATYGPEIHDLQSQRMKSISHMIISFTGFHIV